jgi:hypothetical protein
MQKDNLKDETTTLIAVVILLKIVKIASFTLLIKTGVITIIGVCVLKETMKGMLHRMFIIITDNGGSLA